MSVDICFNKAAALRAGMYLKSLPNASPEETVEAVRRGESLDHIIWMCDEQLCMAVPNIGEERFLSLDEGAYLPEGMDDVPENYEAQYIVQSRTHRTTLLEWFNEHDIDWEEH
jgi:hypothetical protein